MENSQCIPSSNGYISREIFGIPYSIYDRFIDCLTDLMVDFEKFACPIPLEQIKFFSMADNYLDNECSRFMLGKVVMRQNLLQLARAVNENNTNVEKADALISLIDQCLARLGLGK